MKLKITVHGIAYEVDVEILDPGEGFAAPSLPQLVPGLHSNGGGEPVAATHPRAAEAPSVGPRRAADVTQSAGSGEGSVAAQRARGAAAGRAPVGREAAHSAGSAAAAVAEAAHSVGSPIAGTVIEVKCRPGETVQSGQVLVVLEAMKMKTSIAAPAPGRIARVPVAAGDAVREGQILVELE